MQNIRSLCTNSNLGKRRSIQPSTFQQCWNMRASRKPFLLSQLRNINIRLDRNDALAISNATPRETDNRKFAEVFSTRRRKKLFRDVEEYSTIAERFLTTPRRKNRVISMQNVLERLLLLQSWYDHMLLRHIRLQVFQEPLSDPLVKGIWRWHA